MKLVQHCTKFQIGAIPGHRPQEHLFVMNSALSLYSMLDIPLILQLFDISKFFNKESLRDRLDTLYQAGIHGKLYRLWYEFNHKNVIQVQTGVGVSNKCTTDENITQGSIGSGLISALNLDSGVNSFFEGSNMEVSYGPLRLQPLLFQDDVGRLCSSPEAAQAGNDKMAAITSLKQLEINVDKSVYILFGNKHRVTHIRNLLKENPPP